jgi:hypothetical protein
MADLAGYAAEKHATLLRLSSKFRQKIFHQQILLFCQGTSKFFQK